MKAIHNATTFERTFFDTVFNTSKIQNESNSQHVKQELLNYRTVFNTSKIQNESNSQRKEIPKFIKEYCV